MSIKQREISFTAGVGKSLVVAPAGLVALVLLLGCGSKVLESAANAVVVVDIDTLRADGLGCYGNQRATSPAIDGLAERGYRFNWAFSQAPNTPPSQASILTGLYPSRHGRVGDFDRIRDNVPTLAEIVRAAGFRTAAFVDGGFMSPGSGVERGFDVYSDLAGSGLAASVPRAVEWLSGVGDAPFLLLLHTYDVHSPYAPPEPFRSRFARLVPAPTPGFEPTVEVLEKVRKARHRGEPMTLTREDIDFARALYDAEIRAADEQISSLLVGIEKLGLGPRTIIVVISDHGEEFGEHGSVLHEKLYSSVLRVPFVITVPDWSGGVVIEEIAQTVDLVPTLLQLLRIPTSPVSDGRSAVPSMQGAARRGFAFAESPFFSQERSLAVGPWRLLLRRDSGQAELYRFRDDPDEQHELATAEWEKTRSLRGVLDGLEKRLEVARAGGAPGRAEVDAETLRQLTSLGYLN